VSDRAHHNLLEDTGPTDWAEVSVSLKAGVNVLSWLVYSPLADATTTSTTVKIRRIQIRGDLIISYCSRNSDRRVHQRSAPVPQKCPVRAPGRNAPLIRFLISALCIYCLLVYIVCFLAYPFFTFSLLICSYLSFPLRIDPLSFHAGCHKRRLNVALVFCLVFF